MKKIIFKILRYLKILSTNYKFNKFKNYKFKFKLKIKPAISVDVEIKSIKSKF